MAQPHLRAVPQHGDEREDQAIAIAAAVAAIFGAAELALIASVAAAVRKAAMSGARSVTPRQLTAIVAYTLALAEQRARRAILAAGVGQVPRRVTSAIEQASGRAYESALEGYRQALAAVEYAPSSSAILRLQAAQRALDDLAGSGVTGLTDRAGRDWDVVSYVEMATRTGLSRAWSDRVAQGMASDGLDLALVAHGSEPVCGNCAPYLGKLLSLSGGTRSGAYVIFDATGRSRSADVAGTLAQARANGWGHPNCRCWLAQWHDGADLSRVDSFQIPPASVLAARYAREQDQRARQRSARQAARRQHAAITPAAKAKARAAVTRHGRHRVSPAHAA